MTDKNNKDATPEQPSDKLTVKQLAEKFKGFGTDWSGQTAVKKNVKTAVKDKTFTTERNSIRHDVDSNVQSSSNILQTTGTGIIPVSNDTPTETIEQGSLIFDTCLQTEYEVEHGSDVIEECMEKTNSDVIRPEATLIDRLNWIEIGQLLQSLNMNAVTSTEDPKPKLKQTLFSGQRVDSMSKKIKDVLNKTVERYKGLKTNLLNLYSEVITTVQNDSFKDNMGEVIEMRFPHYEYELQTIETVLQNMTEEFEIVVSGETSSGKSTFLNVLLGERILPSHHLHTTASLCRLRNSENRRIECFVENRIVEKVTLTADSNELRGKLDSITKTLLSKDGDHEPLKAIDIYWPVSSLHENVVLVDTPGIGERDALTRQVVEFVPKAAGYIFIIDSSHAGGVQDSGIKKLIEAIAVSPSKEDCIKGLSNMIFVCNKWDIVPMQDRAAVMEDTKRKIRKYCGQLSDWQIITFNGELELKLLEWKANPTDDFNTLLKSLETLMVCTIETRLRDKYRWIRTFVSELLGLINVRMNAAKQSKENVELEMQKARNQLDLANRELEKCSEVETLIHEEAQSLLQDLEEHLKSEEVQRQYFDWTDCAPEVSKVKDDGPKLISARLQEVMLEWATSETGPLQEASVRIADRCKEMQSKIDVRISNLNQLDLGFRLAKSSDKGDKPSSSYEETDISRKEIAIVVASSPIWISVGLVVLVVGLIPGIVWAINRVTNTKKRSIKKMTKLTKEIINLLVSENHLQTYINDSFTDNYIKWLTKFKNDTLCTITSTRSWLLRMEEDLNLTSDQEQMFQSLQTNLTHCSNRLHKFKNDI
ncbi:hypothetical protein CHS0354_020317 [Potamilus streckersoni]|uniref:Dynamin N-terminal domain-containing protein n=1 Tax=Potamilus streckersoni TaxID=2493646 RepID=A0AAE0S653_9BIVA|nr:hypothetical protein CHS0354_020317 [Potamilus streckersoni]